jgi:hypothetical protein
MQDCVADVKEQLNSKTGKKILCHVPNMSMQSVFLQLCVAVYAEFRNN